jgi:uncharacterized protein
MIETKLDKLKNRLKEMESVLIAYSGGVDSTFLLKIAMDMLGDNVLAVTARSETYTRREYEEAVAFARTFGVKHLVVSTKELEIQNFSSNPINRCYYCKKELFTMLKEIANKNNIKHVIDGTNADDTDDYRPGLLAIEELGVRSPLKEAGLSKQEIRTISREMNLPTWDKPAIACLASRFPYGMTIDMEKLSMVEKAEECLHDLGFRQVRVRHHDLMARIEVMPDELLRIVDERVREEIIETLRNIGYQYITLDLQGYRMGSMNEVLAQREKVDESNNEESRKQ